MNWRTSLIVSAVALLAGCSTVAPRQEPGPVRSDPGLFLLAPAAAGFEASLTHEVTFDRGTAHFEGMAIVEVSSADVVLAGLSPFGTRMLSLRWDGKRLSQERDASLPKQLPLEIILRDIQLVFWPAAAIRSALPGMRWALSDEGRDRVLLEVGRPVVRIRFSSDDRLHADVEFEHLGLGYRLKIHPLQDD